MNKKEIRKKIKDCKSLLTIDEIETYSDKVCNILMNQEFYKISQVLYVYLSYNQEILTKSLIERAWLDGKKVAVPKTYEDSRMEFITLRSFDDVKPGLCNIPEPVCGEIANDKAALILMPGVAFDREFNRIGYGGGYYDRYLDRKSDCSFLKVALAYDFQLLPHIETEKFDKKVDAIITENELLIRH